MAKHKTGNVNFLTLVICGRAMGWAPTAAKGWRPSCTVAKVLSVRTDRPTTVDGCGLPLATADTYAAATSLTDQEVLSQPTNAASVAVGISSRFGSGAPNPHFLAASDRPAGKTVVVPADRRPSIGRSTGIISCWIEGPPETGPLPKKKTQRRWWFRSKSTRKYGRGTSKRPPAGIQGDGEAALRGRRPRSWPSCVPSGSRRPRKKSVREPTFDIAILPIRA